MAKAGSGHFNLGEQTSSGSRSTRLQLASGNVIFP